MRTLNNLFVAASLSIGLLLAGCSGNNSPSTAPTNPSQNSKLSWTNSANGTEVLDSSGTPYYFSASTGCMFNNNSNLGPTNFCLTPSTSQTSGYAYYGATGCTSPASNSACNTPTFDVVLTNNPSGTGCIAVLGNGSSDPTAIAGTLSVVDTNGSFTIGGGTSATAYKTYWDGAIPICGGSSMYEGTYTSTDTSAASFANGWTVANGSCVTPYPKPTTRNSGAPFVSFTIDSGGIIDSEGSNDKLIGIVASPASSTVINSSAVAVGGDCTPIVNITGVTQNTANKWVFTGTELFAGASTPFTAVQN